MKITKRQLKRLISEAMPPGGAPDVVGATTGVPGGDIQNLVDEYKEWAVEYMGTPSGPNSSSVLATFLIERGLDQGPAAGDIMKDMAREMRFDIVDVRSAVKVAREEFDAGGALPEPEVQERGFKESAMRITKRQLRRIVKEEKRKLMREGVQSQEEALFSALDQYVMALDEDMGYDVPPDQLKAEVLNFVDGYFEDSEYAAEQAEREEGLPR